MNFKTWLVFVFLVLQFAIVIFMQQNKVPVLKILVEECDYVDLKRYTQQIDIKAQKRIDSIEITAGEVLLYYETKSEIDRAMALGLELYLKSPKPITDIHTY